jgi:hypothetical protein
MLDLLNDTTGWCRKNREIKSFFGRRLRDGWVEILRVAGFCDVGFFEDWNFNS